VKTNSHAVRTSGGRHMARLLSWWCLVLAVPFMMAACSSDDSQNPSAVEAPLDSEAVKSAVAVADPDGSITRMTSFSISAMPVSVIDTPTSGEAPVSGNIMVSRAGVLVKDAVVKVNGAEVPSIGSFYDVAESGLSGLGPGSTITIEVTTTDPPETRSFTFDCPSAITIESPAPDSIIAPNQNLQVTWHPGISYDAPRMAGGPLLGNFMCSSGSVVSGKGRGANFITLAVGQTSQAFPVDRCGEYLLELQYPGAIVKVPAGDSFDIGYCSIRHRVRVYGQ
jgi:hypothetical protein